MEGATDAFDLEPERYELLEHGPWDATACRRDFLKGVGGLAVLLVLPDRTPAQESPGRRGRRGRGGRTPREIGAWLHVGEDGSVTAYTGKAEVGQDIRTSLTQAVAEELHVAPAAVHMVMGDTDLTPYDRGTFGSRTTPVMAARLMRVAATAREVIIGLATTAWGVGRATLSAEDGKVSHRASGRSAAYGELTEGRRLVEVVDDDAGTTPAAAWRVAGKTLGRVNARDLVTGRHAYASDIRRPAMLFGRVLRPPSFGARLVAADTRRAEEVDGVHVVREGGFIGVAARDELQAARALAAIDARWKETDQPSDAELFGHLRAHARAGSGRRRRTSRAVVGRVAEGLRRSDVRLEATYTVAYVAHAPLEPRAAAAEWTDGRLTVWTGTQRPFGVRRELVRALGLSEDRVRVVVPDTGSGYGGKHTGEAAVEAARLARRVDRPVCVHWTREEEFTWAYFRPAGVIDVRSGASGDGRIMAWEFENWNSGASAIRPLYAIPHQDVRFLRTDSPLRQGSYRALAATANHFARESHVDELAHASGRDPVAFRLANIEDDRLRGVLQAVADRAGWEGRAAAGRGVACGFDKGGYVATCADVAVDEGATDIRVTRLVTAFECGAIVNPDGLRNQVEGALIQGLGGALFEAVRFEGGRVTNPRFSKYRVPRFQDVPVLDTVLLDRRDIPSAGAGETPIVCVAPAIANAVFAATGIRRRSLPLV